MQRARGSSRGQGRGAARRCRGSGGASGGGVGAVCTEGSQARSCGEARGGGRGAACTAESRQCRPDQGHREAAGVCPSYALPGAFYACAGAQLCTCLSNAGAHGSFPHPHTTITPQFKNEEVREKLKKSLTQKLLLDPLDLAATA